MRISSGQMYDSVLNGIKKYQVESNQIQKDIANGYRSDISTVDKIKVMNDNVTISKNAQYISTIDNLNVKYNKNDTDLDNINNSLMKIKDLITQGLNSTNTTSDLNNIKEQYNSLKNNIENILNQKNEIGNYIYSGTTDVKPFTSLLSYNGNNQKNQVYISDNQLIDTNIAGSEIINANGQSTINSIDTMFQNGSLNASALDDLQSMIDNVSLVRTKVGSQLNVIDNSKSYYEKDTLNLQEEIENLQGIDYASSITKLNQNQNNLQALYKIQASNNKSLFDYM